MRRKGEIRSVCAPFRTIVKTRDMIWTRNPSLRCYLPRPNHFHPPPPPPPLSTLLPYLPLAHTIIYTLNNSTLLPLISLSHTQCVPQKSEADKAVVDPTQAQILSPTLLVLILFDPHSPHEVIMKSHLTRYLERVKNILFFFVTYGNQKQTVVVTGHDIIVRGAESMKNILHKTLVALRYCFECKDYRFDYVIRSSISTVFNFGKLPISDFIKKKVP